MTEVTLEQKVAAEIEEVLLKNEMALQPFMNRSIQGTVAAVRLVSTKEEVPVSDKPTPNADNKTNPREDKGSGDEDGAVGTA